MNMRQLASARDRLGQLWLQAQVWVVTTLATPRPGQGLVEYGLILTLIAVVVVGIMSVLGQTVSGLWYQRVVDALDDILN